MANPKICMCLMQQKSRELSYCRIWKRSCIKIGWCTTAPATLMGKHRIPSSFFEIMMTGLFRLWCNCCHNFSCENFWIYTIKNDKRGKKPKQNSRAQENCFWQARRLDTQFTFLVIMKHSGLLIPMQLHKQLVVLINLQRLTLLFWLLSFHI